MEATSELSIPLQLHGVIKIQLDLMDKLFPSRIIAANSIINDIDVILGKDFLKAERYIVQMAEIQNGLHLTNMEFLMLSQQL